MRQSRSPCPARSGQSESDSDETNRSPASRSRETRCSWYYELLVERSSIAQEHQGDANGHQTKTGPTLRAHALAEKEYCPARSGHVAECSDRNYETYIEKGESAQQGEEAQGHHADSSPQPSHAHGTKNYASDRQGTKIFHFSHHFHGPGNTELTASAGHDDQEKKNRLEQINFAPDS